MLLGGLVDPGAERERYFATISDLSLKYDTVVSVMVMELLNKSERSVDAAKLLLSDGYSDFAVSREAARPSAKTRRPEPLPMPSSSWPQSNGILRAIIERSNGSSGNLYCVPGIQKLNTGSVP